MNSKYEKAIRDYVLKGQSEVGFKVLEMSEQGTVTLADSIAYLTDEFRKDKELFVKRIELAKKLIEYLQAATKLKSEYNKYTEDIERVNIRIDSLRTLHLDNLQG